MRVPVLCLGGIFDIPSHQHVLYRALELGIVAWDTADCYLGGQSEKGIGMFLKKHPDVRPQLTLISKSDLFTPDGLDRLLDRSLARLQTSYLDVYLIHDLRDPACLTDEVRRWAEKEKEAGRIRAFGFSTHRNMEQHLRHAAKLPWLDVVMTTCNFRTLQDAGMREALSAAAQAGLGLIAIKTQASGPLPIPEEAWAERLRQSGMDIGQIKLKYAWAAPGIATICSQMDDLQHMAANVAAARDPTELSEGQCRVLDELARETANRYCAGCEWRCAGAVPTHPPIADCMRALMYATAYGDRRRAREQIPSEIRCAAADLAAAERACPRGLPVARLVREALELA